MFPAEFATSGRRSYDPRMKRRAPTISSGGLWLYGIHPIRAALVNSRRKVHRALLTQQAADVIGRPLLARVRHDIGTAEHVARSVPPGAVHQGAALLCEPLPRRELEDVLQNKTGERRIVLVLDQITDPHNVGAILRSAKAFGASAVVVQDRHAPPESGALAKAASGALDLIPYIQVVNVARAVEALPRQVSPNCENAATSGAAAAAREGQVRASRPAPAERRSGADPGTPVIA